MFWALLLTLGASSRRLPAQTPAQFVRGTVTDSASRQGIAGSIVMVTGANGTVLVRTLANERGAYVVNFPAAARGIRVLHMGFRPRDVPVARSASGTIQVNVELSRLQTMLAAMNVQANGNSSARKDRAVALSLYEQARDGLLATIVAREAPSTQMKRIRFDRILNRRRNGIASQDVYIDTVVSLTAPFKAVRTAQQFIDGGYFGDSAGYPPFFAPDAETIVDDAFRDGYCFGIGDRDKARPNQVALGFERGKRTGKQIDIEGTIWLDTLNRTLASLDFRYVGLNSAEEAYKLGGYVQFREMPNGSVLIDEWSLRLLDAKKPDTVFSQRYNRPAVAIERQQIDVHETGGALVSVRWPDGSSWRAKLGTLRIEATTRDGKPAAGMLIGLIGSNYASTFDQTGETELAELMPGPYRAAVLDSTLATIAITLPTSLTFQAVRDSVHHEKIVAPTSLDYAEERCKSEPSGGLIMRVGQHGGLEWKSRTPGAGVSFFVYVTGPDNLPLPNVAITEAIKYPNTPAAYTSVDVTGGKTDSGGRYFSCWNYQLDESVQIWIRQPGTRPQLTVQHLTQTVEAVRIVANTQIVANTDTVPLTVRGTAFDSLSNRPLVNAAIHVSGLDGTATTDANGAFEIRGIESGFYTFSAQHALLDTLGFNDVAVGLNISDAQSTVSLTIPSFAALWASGCGSRKGRITNAAGDGVSNVRVSVNGIVGARSDSAGAYVIQRVRTGSRTVQFVSVGMAPITRIVELAPDQVADVSITLERVTVLEKVQVTATAKQQLLTQFGDRKRLGFGSIQDSTQLSRAPGLGTAIRMLPGVLLGRMFEPPIMLRMASGLGAVCEANYFLDGHRVEIEAFYSIPIKDIAWIESYPRRYAVPREFMGGRECGAVALFTKFSVGK